PKIGRLRQISSQRRRGQRCCSAGAWHGWHSARDEPGFRELRGLSGSIRRWSVSATARERAFMARHTACSPSAMKRRTRSCIGNYGLYATLLFACATSGCGAAGGDRSSDDTATVAQPILGVVDPDSNDPSVVAVEFTPFNGTPTLCSGSVVSQTQVLTAK